MKKILLLLCAFTLITACENEPLDPDFAGGNNHMKSGNIVAASPKVLQAMVKDMRPHLSETLAK